MGLQYRAKRAEYIRMRKIKQVAMSNRERQASVQVKRKRVAGSEARKPAGRKQASSERLATFLGPFMVATGYKDLCKQTLSSINFIAPDNCSPPSLCLFLGLSRTQFSAGEVGRQREASWSGPIECFPIFYDPQRAKKKIELRSRATHRQAGIGSVGLRVSLSLCFCLHNALAERNGARDTTLWA